MLKELLEHVGEQAVRGRLPMRVEVKQEPDHVYLITERDGSLSWREARPAPRQHKAGDLSAIIARMQRLADAESPGEGETETPCPEPVIWYSRTSVVLLLDDATRRDRVTLPLELHPQFQKLQELEKNKPQLDQKGFVSLLRIGLAGCLGPAGNLLDVVRQVKFKQHQAGEGVIQHGKSSIGRSIQSELTGAGTIPEQTVLDVPVFHGPLARRRHLVGCAIEVDASTERFQLIPFPGALEEALCQAEAALGEDLRSALGSQAAIYYGTP